MVSEDHEIDDCNHDIGYLVINTPISVVCLNCETFQDPTLYQILKDKYVVNTKVFDEQDLAVKECFNLVRRRVYETKVYL